MQKFTKLSNGHVLTIEIDEVNLLAEIDKDIQEMEDLKKKYADYEKERVEAEESGDENYDDWRWEYPMDKVYGDRDSDFCTPDEIIADREDFKKDINRLAAGDGTELWILTQLKKNGTFKKTSKPTIREAINGSYWEDSYGWNTLVFGILYACNVVVRTW